MAYTIDTYSNSKSWKIEDGTIDQTTDLKLVGKNYAGYGEIQNENFIFLLENFAGGAEPPRALDGQLWFDTDNNKLKFYDGARWRTTGGAEVSSSQPTGLTTGDFWWDSANEQLYSYNGTEFVLIGPQSAGSGQTQIISRTVRDSNENSRGIITGVVNDEVVFTVSSQDFTLFADEDLRPEFDRIRPGITLRNTTETSGGVTSGDYIVYGTASAAKGLVDSQGVFVNSDFLARTTGTTFTGLLKTNDTGIAIGTGAGDLKLKIENNNEAIIQNDVGTQIIFRTRDINSVTRNPLRIQANTIIPGFIAGTESQQIPDTLTVYLGTSEHKFEEVHANAFKGLSDVADKLLLGTDASITSNWKSASVEATSDTVVVRTASATDYQGRTYDAGSIKATYFIGTATAAQYADLAEVYSTDQEYAVGTVMMICEHDTHESEACSDEGIPIGVISENPAYIMNSAAEGQAIGLKGRVPVRVVGSVKKGQAVYVAGNGTASVAFNGRPMIGIALETNDQESEKLVECVLKV